MLIGVVLFTICKRNGEEFTMENLQLLYTGKTKNVYAWTTATAC